MFFSIHVKNVSPPVPPWGTFLHQWCALILASPYPPSGSETGPLGTDQAGPLLSDEPTVEGQSGLHKEKRGGLLMHDGHPQY